MIQNHRKLVSKEQKEQKELQQVQGRALQTNAFRGIQEVDDYSIYLQAQLEKYKRYCKPPFIKFTIQYGGHDKQNKSCKKNKQQQQNQNLLPLINISPKESKQFISKTQFQKNFTNWNSQFDDNKSLRQIQSLKTNDLRSSFFPQIKKQKINEQKSPKFKCDCQQFDQILNVESQDVYIKLSKFLIEFKEEDKQNARKTIHFESDLINIEHLTNSFDSFEKLQQFPYVKLNQQISKTEDQLLNKTGCYWTSSMIDAFANFLSGLDERYYFSLPKQQRERHERLFIFTSDFITNCNLDSQDFKDKWLLLIMEKLENFKAIQYQFYLIYKRIAFVVNKSNYHWYLVTVNLDERYIIVYDSLRGNKQHYEKVEYLLTFLFYELQKNELEMHNIPKDQYKFKTIIKTNFLNQNDGYSCGQYTCIALEYFYNLIQRKDYKSKQQIKDYLKKILLHKIKEEDEDQDQEQQY